MRPNLIIACCFKYYYFSRRTQQYIVYLSLSCNTIHGIFHIITKNTTLHSNFAIYTWVPLLLHSGLIRI